MSRKVFLFLLRFSIITTLIFTAIAFASVLLSRHMEAVGPLAKSIPLAPYEDVTFFIVGDTGTGTPKQYAVADAMNEACTGKKPHGVIMLGDNFYMSGVSSVEDPQWDTKYKQPYRKGCLKDVPFYPILGNHDYRQSPQAQIEYSQKDSLWHFPHRFYSVLFDPLLKLIALDSNNFNFCFDSSRCTFDFFLEATAVKPPITIVTTHHPITSQNEKGGSYSGEWLRPLARPFFCDRATIWLSGHSHHMEHSRIKGCNTEFLIIGSGGAGLYDVEAHNLKAPSDDGVQFSSSTYGFAQLNANAERIHITFYDVLNTPIYIFDRKL